LPVYHLTLAVVRDNHAVARWATVLALFFPSMILWSVLNIREAPTIFCFVSATCCFARFQRSARAARAHRAPRSR
jgi:4-amino-4-deoxy-L-arabinose transferase-like glycosyltransferase